MAILPIVHFPDSRLKEKSLPVDKLTGTISAFIADLIETMESFPGCVGLAACQVGFLSQILVMDVGRYRKVVSNHGRVVLINPRLIKTENPIISREGCLSVPDYTGNATRFQKVVVGGVNEKGQSIQMEAEDFEAIVLQHEIDHLNGMLFLDRVSSLKTDVFRRKTYLH